MTTTMPAFIYIDCTVSRDGAIERRSQFLNVFMIIDRAYPLRDLEARPGTLLAYFIYFSKFFSYRQ